MYKPIMQVFRGPGKWILWLDCGHVTTRPIVMSDETDSEKPPPRRVKCQDCESAEVDARIRARQHRKKLEEKP